MNFEKKKNVLIPVAVILQVFLVLEGLQVNHLHSEQKEIREMQGISDSPEKKESWGTVERKDHVGSLECQEEKVDYEI